jgi:hypothetical protein
MKCAYHQDRVALGQCSNCGCYVCTQCSATINEKMYCSMCAGHMFSGGSAATGIATAAISTANTSGMGKRALVPEEIKGWNWGAFLLNWIWSIGNNVWLGLLCWIPFAAIVMVFILGAKGSEWAWRNKRWDSIEHFRKTQQKWVWAGLGVVLANIAYLIIIEIAEAITG